jgi:hypothetical protein
VNNLEMLNISNFLPELAALLPDTHRLLSSANLFVHPFVSLVVLHGSRGLAGGWRPESDIDLSLIVETRGIQISQALFYDITRTTLDNWKSAVELDLAVIYDMKRCGLKCFEQTTWQQEFCQLGGVDCFGIYKIQKGFHGFLTHAGIQVQLMYPCLKIWHRVEYQNHVAP